MEEIAAAEGDVRFGAAPRSGKSGALFLRDEEQFVFDFGGAAVPAHPNGDDNDENGEKTGKGDGAEAAETRTRRSAAAAPLGAEEVRRGFYTALAAGDGVFLKLSLDDAISKFQSGMRQYGEALSRHAWRKRQQERQSHAQRRNNKNT